MKHVLVVIGLFAAIGCKDKGASSGGGDAMAKMAELRNKMCACKDPACAKKVSEEMASWSKSQPSEKPAAMSADDQKKATDLGTQLGECMMKANTAADAAAQAKADGSAAPSDGSAAQPAAVDASATAAKTAGGLPKECGDYKVAIDKLATCEKMSKQARETLVKGYADAAEGWATLPEAAKASLSTSCKGGTEAVLAVAKAQCGW